MSQLQETLRSSSASIFGGTPRHRSSCIGCGREFISLNGHLARAPTCARILVQSQTSLPRSDPQDSASREVLVKLEEAYGAPYINRPASGTGIWYKRWRTITRLAGKQYDLPDGAIPCRFIDTLTSELDALVMGTYPSERVLVYVSVVLQRDRMVKQAKDIRKLVERRLGLWEEGHYDALIREALTLDGKLAGRGRPNKQIRSKEHVNTIFHRLMLRGKVKEAVRWLDDGGKTTVLAPETTIDDQGKTVLDELERKHPDPTMPDPSLLAIPDGEEMPPLLSVQVTEEHVEVVARKLHGGGGPSGSTSEQWTDFLLRYGRHSQRLRSSVAALANKLANQSVPWESIQALVASRMVALDKNPGVRPIGVGECLRRILGKCMAAVTGDDVTAACKESQLCGGLAAGIEGAIHAMVSMFEENSTPDSCWGLLLVDADNAFNRMNRAAALWQARILWPRCAQFLYNTYRGHAELVFRGSEEKLHSKEGVTQGDPLAMLLYALSTVPLITRIQDPRVTQCWFADDSSAQGQLNDLKHWWDNLQLQGPDHGYFPQGQKSCLVVHPDSIEAATSIFSGSGIKIVTGKRFLGGYVGLEEEKQHFLDTKVESWVRSVEKLSEAASTQPQSAYAAFVKSVQFRWQFVQRVVSGNDNTYESLRSAIRSSFIPALLKGEGTQEECDLFSLPVQKGGLALTDPVTTARPFFITSRTSTSVLADAIGNGTDFVHEHHLSKLAAGKKEARKRRDEEADVLLQRVLAGFPASRKRALERSIHGCSGSKTSGWLSVLPIKRQHFDLSPTQFRDALALRYMRPATDIPANCDGCGGRFTIEHAMVCKKGGLVTRRHNEVRDVLGQLMENAWGNCIREPIISDPSDSHPGLRGDLACRGVWEAQREALFDIRVTDTDAPSYLPHTVASVFKSAEEEKKRKYLAACEQRHASFTPLVVSVDAHFAPQTSAFVKVLSERLADKWSRPQGVVRAWVRVRLAFAVLRASSLCIHSSRKKWRSAEDLLGGADGAALHVDR